MENHRRENGEANVSQETNKGEVKLKKRNTLINKVSLIKGLAAAAVIVSIFYMTAFTASAAEGTVTAESVNIRKETSTDSEIVGSTVKGKKIDILGAVKDSSGTVWYKVAVSGGGYGYIRSDCVSTSATIPVSENTGASGSSGGSTSKPADTVATAIGEQAAVINAQTNVRVRTGASTQHDTVTSLPNGTPVTLIGEANDSQGKKWYQIRCDYNGRQIEGYVLASLTAASSGESSGDGSTESTEGGENPEGEQGEGNPEGEQGEGQEGAPEEGAGEAPAEAPVEEHKDYEIVYIPNEAGEYEYFFNNYIAGNQQPVSNLLAVVDSNEKMQGQIRNGKIIIIILAAVIVILFIVITVLLFKIRDLYYEDDEDEDEEEEEEEEPVPVKRRVRRSSEEEEEEPALVKRRTKKRMEEEDESVPVKKKKPVSSREGERPVKSGKSQSGEREGKELYAAENKEPVKKTTARRPQNFLADDDEFEFEFLNMDDKDL